MLTMLEFANHFGLINFVGSLEAQKREITTVNIDRAGLELIGFLEYFQEDRLLVFGYKEIGFINSHDQEIVKKAFEKIAQSNCPGLIICQNLPCPAFLLEIAVENNFPIYGSTSDTSDFHFDAVLYLSEKLAPTTSLHATFLEIFNIGALIIGESGIGKSEVALELIKRGHYLVADDKVNVSLIRGKLHGTAPELLVGMMEVRGIGIIDCPRMFGINSMSRSGIIKYIFRLVPFESAADIDRLGTKQEFYEILGMQVPLITLPVKAARSMAEIIEVAITNLKLKEFGYDSSYEFESRMRELMGRKKYEHN